MAKLAIERLKADGISVEPEEVLCLQRLAEKTQHPHGKTDPIEWADLPTRVGNIDLWPLSMGSEWWLHNCAYAWFGRSAKWTVVAEAFALAYGHDMTIIKGACDAKTAKRMLKTFYSLLSVSLKTLKANVEQLLKETQTQDIPVPALDEKKCVATEWGDIIAFLCHQCGGTPEDWIWKYPADQVKHIFAAGMEYNSNGNECGISDDKAHAAYIFDCYRDELKRKKAVANG